MWEYIKFAAAWVVFMLVLGIITLVVPKIAAKIDKIRENNKGKKRENMFSFGQTSYMEPSEPISNEDKNNSNEEE